MKLRLRRRSAKEDIGRLIRRRLCALSVIDHRPHHVTPHRSKGDVGLVDLRREARAVAGDGEADDVSVNALSAFLFAELLELARHRAVVMANGAQAISLERIAEGRE